MASCPVGLYTVITVPFTIWPTLLLNPFLFRGEHLTHSVQTVKRFFYSF